MDFKVNANFRKKLGFDIDSKNILDAVKATNAVLETFPNSLYSSIDFKTLGAMIGSILCRQIAVVTEGAVVNPIEKGHPDLIPGSGIDSTEAILRNYPEGLEVKGTIGNVAKGANLKAGQQRIQSITGITWQAHHSEVNNLLGIIWDFANHKNNFNYPAITGAFFSEELTQEDWGAISGTEGRNTKVTGMTQSGKHKMGKGWVLIYNNEQHINKYKKLLNITNLEER